jgi:hypothetical protein
MLKLTVFLGLLAGACALDTDTSSVGSLSTTTCVCDQDCDPTCDKDCEPCDCPPPPGGPTCVIRGEVIDLDALEANVDNDDERVSFCHATGSETNPYILLKTSIEGCNGHANENHEPGGNVDIFPTGGCAD